MNPVDHPHGGVSIFRTSRRSTGTLTQWNRVTISTSVRLRPSHDTPSRVKRRVSLLREGRVCCVVPRRRRSKGAGISWSHWDGVKLACLHLLMVLLEGRRRAAPEGKYYGIWRTKIFEARFSHVKGVNETRSCEMRDRGREQDSLQCPGYSCRAMQDSGWRVQTNNRFQQLSPYAMCHMFSLVLQIAIRCMHSRRQHAELFREILETRRAE